MTDSSGQPFPQDPVADTAISRFAAALRELRDNAGSPSFRKMGQAVNYAPSTLSDAAQGKRPPTRAVTEAFARACGADPDEWGERWEQSFGANTSLNSPPPAPARWPHRALIRRAALIAVTAAVAATATWFASPRGTAPAAAVTVSASPSVFTMPADGTDPTIAGCGPDDTVLGEMPVNIKPVGSGMIELKYSPRCQGGWARFYLNPNSTPVFVEVRIQASDGRASAFAYMAEGNTPVYTDLLHPARGCLEASVVAHPQDREPVLIKTPCLSG